MKIGVCNLKTGVCFLKIGVCSFENRSLFFENQSLFLTLAPVSANLKYQVIEDSCKEVSASQD